MSAQALFSPVAPGRGTAARPLGKTIVDASRAGLDHAQGVCARTLERVIDVAGIMSEVALFRRHDPVQVRGQRASSGANLPGAVEW